MRDLGIMPPKVEDAPINALLQKISDLDQDKIAVIARTLGQASVFNEVVREQTQADGDRRALPARSPQAFNSIRDDSKKMVDQIADAKIDLLERVNNVWMKISRGDIADRFDKIKETYLDVTRSTKDQIEREQHHPRRLPRLPRRAEAGRGAGARGAARGREEAGGRQGRRSARPPRRSRPSRARSPPSARGSSSSATSICAAPRTRRSATRSPRTSPTTSPSATTPPRSSWPG